MGPPPDINITVFNGRESFSFATRKGEYRNLMVLLYDKLYLDGFGECKGIGRCGTCHVRVLGIYDGLKARVANENSTLSKMKGVTQTSRLACQMNIDETLDGIVVEIISD